MSKPTPKLLRSTGHAARKLTNVLHATSLGHASGGSGATATAAQGAGRGGAAAASHGRRVERTGRRDGPDTTSRQAVRPASTSSAVVHRQRTSTSAFGLNTAPHSYPFYLPSHGHGTTAPGPASSSSANAYLAAHLSTTAYGPPLYIDPPPFPPKLQLQQGFEGGYTWTPRAGPAPARSSSPEYVVAEESGSRGVDSLLAPRRGSWEVDGGFVPPVQPQSSQGFATGRSFGTSLAPSDASFSSPGKDLAGPSASLVQRKASSLVFHPGAYGLAKKRHQQRPVPRAGPIDPSDPAAFLTPPDEHGAQTRLRSTQIGEDAYFLRADSLGIADGVGGWSNTVRRRRRAKAVVRDEEATEGDEGEAVPAQEDEIYADPGMFARLLMGFCEDSLEGYWGRGDEEWLVEPGARADKERAAGSSAKNLTFENPANPQPDPSAWADRILARAKSMEAGPSAPARPRRPLSPVEVMQRGYERCMACVRAEGIEGSSTCLLAVLQDDELKIANLGDCACVVVRNGEIVFRTEDMQHSFNFPLQLGTNSRDEPMKDAELFTIKVEKHDIVVMSSDGLVDNLFDEDILDVLATFAPPSAPAPPESSRPATPAGLPPFSPQKVSEALVHAAHAASEEAGTASPFMCRAIEEGIDFVGGKRDDISVLVAVVQDHAQT